MLEQDSPPAACLSATPSSRLGGKGQDGKKKCAGYSLAFPGGHTQEEGEARHRQGDSSEALPEILILFPFVNTS